LRGGGGFGRPSSKKAFSAQVARAESEQEGGGQMERQQQQPEQRVSMTSSPMRGLLSRMLSDPYGGKRYARFVLFFCLLFVFFFFLARKSRKMRSFDFRYKN
jgi:predicted PurR-regulated permease PerM